MRSLVLLRVTLILILICPFSCAEKPLLKESKSSRVIENVPFYPQEMFQCGPASLAEVFNFWGVKVSPEEVAQAIYSPSAKGTLNLDMVLYARKKSLKADQYRGSIEDIKTKIDSGYPLIVLVDYGLWVVQQNHFMVIFGYRDDGFIVHSGKTPNKFLPMGDFFKTWEKTNFWTLLVAPA
jgi:ABC-type bacteriocin/lantibiotic exporter with double-glycine peptidase domain